MTPGSGARRSTARGAGKTGRVRAGRSGRWRFFATVDAPCGRGTLCAPLFPAAGACGHGLACGLLARRNFRRAFSATPAWKMGRCAQERQRLFRKSGRRAAKPLVREDGSGVCGVRKMDASAGGASHGPACFAATRWRKPQRLAAARLSGDGPLPSGSACAADLFAMFASL